MPHLTVTEAFRHAAGGAKEHQVPGNTAAAVLRAFLARYPELQARLLLSDGRFGAHFLVYVNGRVVKTDSLETEAVSESSEIKIYPVLAGG